MHEYHKDTLGTTITKLCMVTSGFLIIDNNGRDVSRDAGSM